MDSANFQQIIQVYLANNTEILLHEYCSGCIEIAKSLGGNCSSLGALPLGMKNFSLRICNFNASLPMFVQYYISTISIALTLDFVNFYKFSVFANFFRQISFKEQSSFASLANKLDSRKFRNKILAITFRFRNSTKQKNKKFSSPKKYFVKSTLQYRAKNSCFHENFAKKCEK